MGLLETIHIDGFIKDEYKPFKSEFNGFSFRPSDMGDSIAINVCPQSFFDYADKDISLRMLFDKSEKGSSGYFFNKLQVDNSSILNTIPAIQIREFLPDAKLDQILNFFDQFKQGWNSSTGQDQAKDETLKKAQDAWTTEVETKGGMGWKTAKTLALATKMWKMMQDANLMKTLFDKSGASKMPIMKDDEENNVKKYIVEFPYVLYYTLMGYTTTNKYVVPFNPKQLYQSMGQNGWTDNASFGLNQNSGSSIIGNLVNMIAPNIKINASPVWKPGTYDNYSIQVKFDLYNDTVDAALNNFLFLQTLFPNNQWLQYHIYQHSPDLYDLKIEGFNRLMMCSGNFQCEYKGVIRDPSCKFINQLKGYVSEKYDPASLIESIYNDKLIKIPDIYTITLDFKSLLPNNFNNYILTYIANQNIDIGMQYGHVDSSYTAVSKVISDKITELKEYFTGTQITTDMETLQTEWRNKASGETSK